MVENVSDQARWLWTAEEVTPERGFGKSRELFVSVLGRMWLKNEAGADADAGAGAGASADADAGARR